MNGDDRAMNADGRKVTPMVVTSRFTAPSIGSPETLRPQESKKSPEVIRYVRYGARA
jgi:hypothetical protein